MNNKQELVKWMTEKREDLPFESKVQLLWDFWQNRKQISTILEKSGLDNLEQLESYLEEFGQFFRKHLVDDLESLGKRIENISQDREFWKKEWSSYREDLVAKNDRLVQLDAVLKGSALIFQKQQQVIDQLTQQLESEQIKGRGNKDYQTHLKTDIQRLAKERGELSRRIKELEVEEDKNKKLRDKELDDLKKERDLIISQRDNRPNVTLNDWNNDWSKRPTKQQLTNIRQELVKEKGWWDKWFNDRKNSFDNHIIAPEEDIGFYCLVRDNKHAITEYRANGYDWGFLDIKVLSQPNLLKKDIGNRRLIKSIYEYYRDK